MNTKLILALFELILVYGPSAAISIIKDINNDNVTAEDIRALVVQPPDSYFTGD